MLKFTLIQIGYCRQVIQQLLNSSSIFNSVNTVDNRTLQISHSDHSIHQRLLNTICYGRLTTNIGHPFKFESPKRGLSHYTHLIENLMPQSMILHCRVVGQASIFSNMGSNLIFVGGTLQSGQVRNSVQISFNTTYCSIFNAC